MSEAASSYEGIAFHRPHGEVKRAGSVMAEDDYRYLAGQDDDIERPASGSLFYLGDTASEITQKLHTIRHEGYLEALASKKPNLVYDAEQGSYSVPSAGNGRVIFRIEVSLGGNGQTGDIFYLDADQKASFEDLQARAKDFGG